MCTAAAVATCLTASLLVAWLPLAPCQSTRAARLPACKRASCSLCVWRQYCQISYTSLCSVCACMCVCVFSCLYSCITICCLTVAIYGLTPTRTSPSSSASSPVQWGNNKYNIWGNWIVCAYTFIHTCANVCLFVWMNGLPVADTRAGDKTVNDFH